MRSLSLAVASAAVLFAGVPVAADTPNHCLWDQAAGSWTIYVTAPTPNRDGCPADSSALAIVDAFNVTLSAPDVATTSAGQAGWWSMLYDEGMHIRLPPASSAGGPGSHFFSFFNWTVDASNNVTSHCNRTNVGDYRAEVVTPGARPDFWGCFYGVKQGSSARDVTVQPLRVVAPAPADAVVVTDHAFAARLNAQQSLWKAGATPAFHGMRMNAARRQAGKVRHHDLAATKPRMPAGVPKRQPVIDAAALPPAFDWRNVSGVDYVCPVRSQGQCGSCYSFGSTGSLCARTAIQTKGAISGRYWSPQAVVSCNPYTQGCDGGFSYDVFFGGEGLGLPWESCFPYTSGADGSVPPCSAMCTDQSQFNSVTDVSFVGGYYGGATAELMQEEIYTNGPISVEFLVIPAFTHYTGGVFACSSVADPDAVGLNPWVATNHEVFIVGWGEDAGTPYWIVQNSWGPAWGEEGYFRIVRGVDECAIESIPASGVPVINAAALAAAKLR